MVQTMGRGSKATITRINNFGKSKINQKSILEEISDDEDTNFDDTDSDSEDSLDHGIHGFFFEDEESMSSEDDLESEIPLRAQFY